MSAPARVLLLTRALQEARAREHAQAAFYRALAAAAETSGDAALSERFNELHADEQHHLSRLTARLLELGASPASIPERPRRTANLGTWAADAAAREAAEVAGYERIQRLPLDTETEALLREIVATERHHAEELGGKWTLA